MDSEHKDSANRDQLSYRDHKHDAYKKLTDPRIHKGKLL